jgi:hypothetical protein
MNREILAGEKLAKNICQESYVLFIFALLAVRLWVASAKMLISL